MKLAILYLNNLDISSVEKTYSKTIRQLQDGDFKSADVRKNDLHPNRQRCLCGKS